MAYVIHELERITPSKLAKDDKYEATGIVHFYCCLDHAERHAIAEGFRTSANYSKPEPSTEQVYGNQCEWCGDEIQEITTCKRCGKETSILAVFPGGVCLACWEAKEGQKPLTESDFNRMVDTFKGKAVRRGR